MQRDRIRRLGFRDALRIEQSTLRRLFKATLAATLAWEAAALLDSPRPALASLAAILVVQVTVRATLARSIQLTIGVVVGLVLAETLGHLLGQHWWTIGLIVLGGLVVGELLRLGPFATQAAISALLAFSLGSSYGILRIVDTIVGAAIGVAVNALIAPPTFVAETAATLRRVGEDLGDLLVDIGDGLSDSLHSDDPDRWLDRARAVANDLHGATESLDQAEESVRFNPLTRAADVQLERLSEARLALEHASTQVRGMARALSDVVHPPHGRRAGTGRSAAPTSAHPDPVDDAAAVHHAAPVDSADAADRAGADDGAGTPDNAGAVNDASTADDAGAADDAGGPEDAGTADDGAPDDAGALDDAAMLADVLRRLGPPLVEAGHAVSAFGRLQENPGSGPNREQAIRAGFAAEAGRATAAATVADMGHQATLSAEHLLLASSVLVDTARLIREVDVEHGAHAAAVVAGAATTTGVTRRSRKRPRNS